MVKYTINFGTSRGMNKLFKWLLTLFLGILFFLPTFTSNSFADTESEVKKQQEKAVKLKNLQKEIEKLQKEIKAQGTHTILY